MAAKINETVEFDLDAMRAREAQIALESDQDILDRMRANFQILDDMTSAVKSGEVRSMIVSGPPGVGKSFGVEAVLNKENLFNKIANREPKFEIVKGSMSSIGLYCKLFQHCDPNHVVVFDDCDSVLFEEESLNLLKGALDSGDSRTISWNKDSRILRNEDIPDKFEFAGSVIFITNINFNYVRSKKLRAHLAALESRSHYIDLGMDTMREKFLRIHQVVQDGMLNRYEFTEDGNVQVLKFMQDNATKLREISLRMVVKICDLKRAFPNAWQRMAKTTCCLKN